MPRSAREKSKSGIYHVMLRGINQQQIFEEKEDYERLLQLLSDCKGISEFELYAYCLMGNHIHLLLKEGKEPLDQILKRIGSRFVYWYNTKYQRVGHLFQDRFKSEAIETDKYLQTVLVYIHQNPIKAGICRRPEDYVFSSYGEYVKTPNIVDTEFVFGFWSKEEFVRYNHLPIIDGCLDITETSEVRLTDEQARDVIKKISKCETVAEFQALDIDKRDRYLKRIKEKGLSIRQISRLTGVSFYVARKI